MDDKMAENSREYDPLYIAFIWHFNGDRDYFECHEVLEELWLQENHDLLYQGLLPDCRRLVPFTGMETPAGR
ncbi:DUF309 domain-containing protein [Gorillibacterium massiliense]|uniref:DUF309 domain-containing protein n=1 Tax=Gorillibacterium massiliense TaxID=1280390 RepID=UPI001EE31B41|nr:DUF309 domain-containing protein [Gorillibacterium massiliense]